jgi:cobalt/nickel transport system ATP-binding protein
MSIIEVKDLYYSYDDGNPALKGIDLSIKENTKVAVLGPNGAGKSTLFLHLNGLIQPTGGTVYYRGQKVMYNQKFLKLLRTKVGIVFQNPDDQLFSSTVFQDISFGLLNLGISKIEATNRVSEIARKLGINHLLPKPTHFLSTGEKKMVSLAGVLVMEPEIVICDEPTAGLDPGNCKMFMQVLDDLYKDGTTIIISTHDVDLAYSWANQVVLLNEGQIIMEGNPMMVFSNSLQLKETGLDKPWIIEAWECLPLWLRKPDTPPTNKQEFLQVLKRGLTRLK